MVKRRWKSFKRKTPAGFPDVMMPKMNGMEVCRRVKKELGLKDVFIVLYSKRTGTGPLKRTGSWRRYLYDKTI